MNPKGRDGNPLTCHGCGFYRHFLEACPHSYKNANRTQKVNVTDSTAESATENVVLFTGYNKSEIGQLGEETINCAVLDTACTSAVCGTRWLQCFLDGLSEKELKSVMKKERNYLSLEAERH